MEGFRVERVIAPSGRIGWTLTTAGGELVASVDKFLRYRFHNEASPNTLRGYAYDLKHFFSFLVAQGVDWRHVTPADLGTFTAWLRRPAPNVLQLPGAPPARAESTVSRALSAVFSFYEFHRLQGVQLAAQLDRYLGGRGSSYKPLLHGIAASKQKGVDQFEVHRVGGGGIDELWVPADELAEFNRHIVGTIEVTAEYR